MLSVPEKPTKPAPELLLAQLILSAVLVGLVSHATYEKDYQVPTHTFRMYYGKSVFVSDGTRNIPINEFRASYPVLLLLATSAAYFFVNLILYATIKIFNQLVLYETVFFLLQDVVFCCLMLLCSVSAATRPGERAVKARETEILIASGIAMFCCVSSGVGVYYSYRVYKGL